MTDLRKIDLDKYKNIPFTERVSCQVCNQSLDKPVIDLPALPMTEIYTSKAMPSGRGVVNQAFDFCPRCGHGQLRNVVDINLQYGDTFSYFFRTSESSTGREAVNFFLDFINHVVGQKSFNNVIEIGCNDLYLLKKIQNRANKLVGVDPVLKEITDDLTNTNITAIGDFFENVELDEEFDLVICKDTLEHVSEPRILLEQMVENANDEALFFLQFPCLESILKDCRFDQIFHQHLNYFTLQSVLYLLNELGCELVDYTINFEQWGAILIAFRKGKNRGKFDTDIWNITPDMINERYQVFRDNMAVANRRLKFFSDEKIFGYGAALMLPVLSYYLENDFSCLECIIDDDIRKDGLYYLNLPVEIRTPKALKNPRNAIILLTAVASMNNARAILPKLFNMRPKHVIVPLNTL